MSEFPYVSGYRKALRDSVVAAVVNWVINTFATVAYQSFITDLMRLGRAEFERRLSEEWSEGVDELFEGGEQ